MNKFENFLVPEEKTMKKILFIIMLLTLSIFLASCGEENPTSGFNPYIGGQEAIQIEFVEGMPPSEEGAILDNGKSSFAVQMRITNVGEYDIVPAEGDLLQVTLDGISHRQFNMDSADKTLYLEDPLPGARKLLDGSTRPGQMTVLTFPELSYLEDAPGDLFRKLLVDVCYDYETRSAAEICIADDVTDALISKDEQRICSVNEAKKTHNSGGPVQVTEIKETPLGGSKINLIMKIGHVGQGNIFRAGSINGCDMGTNNPDKNKVSVRIYMSDTTAATVDCTGFDNLRDGSYGEVTLYEQTPATVTCTVESDGSSDLFYEDILNIDLRYRYSESLFKEIIIKDLGTANS